MEEGVLFRNSNCLSGLINEDSLYVSPEKVVNSYLTTTFVCQMQPWGTYVEEGVLIGNLWSIFMNRKHAVFPLCEWRASYLLIKS